jgi:hypothetical protein
LITEAPQSEPKRPGRKPGDQYGQQFRRAVPRDDEIDETYDVPLPPVCPQCGSRHLEETHVATQYQVELPAKPIQRRFDVHVGCCGECGQRVQGRHELQTSDALGAAMAWLTARDEFRKRNLTRSRLRELADELTLKLRVLTCFRRANPDHERFAKHLQRHAAEFFTFLRLPNVEATNYRAEQAIRPSVVNRKVWGGNRTDTSAQHQSVLTSVLLTCDQLVRDPLHFLAKARHADQSIPLFALTRQTITAHATIGNFSPAVPRHPQSAETQRSAAQSRSSVMRSAISTESGRVRDISSRM